ncbi:hypothetical protein [Crocosphaera sp. XPORK-15E]|uniref:hypothetical protein n=1 Tax=Crocosphaera sp. XPORK-15E TaxID=3110247 RepID=UPI002B211836|nr:hypothetical protein [Crocosphaera sp. XPORK-15E]MEA5535142.1 hypothetical protein [Crocosphaera sp. XPORK-15E]
MIKSIKFPFLSLGIVLLTYSTFGWYVGSSITIWTHELVEQGKTWGWFLQDQTVFLVLHIFAIGVVLLITSSLMAPVALVTVLFGSGFKSDSRAIFAVLFWSFAIVFMLRWLTDFARFLILLCAAILGKLELEKQNYPEWQVLSLLGVICLGGFALGLFSYYGLHGDYFNLYSWFLLLGEGRESVLKYPQHFLEIDFQHN